MSARPFVLDPLFQSTKAVPGVGPRMTKLLEKVAGPRVSDLFWHLPGGVVDRRYAPSLRDAQPGRIATVAVRVEAHFPPKREGLPYKIKCTDGSGWLDLTFFHAKGDYLEVQLPVGETRVVSGSLEFYNGYLQMPHPDYIVMEEQRDQIPAIEPVYPLTAGLTQKVSLKIMRAALTRIPVLDEWLDPAYQQREQWLRWHEALQEAHNPKDEADLLPQHPSRRRLAYDELLANQLTMALMRQNYKKQKGRALAGDESLHQKALATFSFELTNSQKQAIGEVREDLRQGLRMHRLLQGDVGSGKTAVAFLAMIHAAGSGCQSVIMAPTEILARQHEKNLAPLAEKCGIRTITFTGRDKGKARAEILSRIAGGEAQIIIGTHALFQESVEFHDLALVVIDEQHRFGVHQRMQLSEKGAAADILVMTATPIPRTLTLTVYGDMDVSRLTEKPAGRQPIDTRLVSDERLDEVVDALQRKIDAKDRIYWVCPLVEESEKVDLAAAEERFLHLQQRYGQRVGLLHGRMKAVDKDRIMESFARGELDILVSTTVIEVGVDVPEATVMVIEHAERFGLAQLHQLRGRIGRGTGKSTCILLYNAKVGDVGKKRLATIRDSEDGFFISEQDLRLRGAGEMLGTKQSGFPEFRLAHPEFHSDLIATAHDDARLILDRDPALLSPRGLALRTLLYLFERDTAIKYLRSG